MTINETPIQCIAFDLGGVLVDVHLDALNQLDRAPQDIERAFFAEKRHEAFGTGTLEASEYVDVASKHLQCQASAIETAWANVVQWKPFAKELLSNLKVPFVFWSNTDPIHFQKLKSTLQLSHPALDKSVLSYQEGVLKPDARFFKSGLKKLSFSPEQILFIDDRLENVQGARRLQIDAHHLQEPKELKPLLKTFAVLFST